MSRLLALGRRLAVLALVAGTASGCAHLAPVPARPRVAHPPRELVVLVHGMMRSPVSMLPLQRTLERDGYRVLNVGYTSYGTHLPTLGTRLGRAVERALREEPAPHVHFVGHSLGNIVIRWTLAHRRPPRLGRVVMLAPPNQGSKAADRFAPYIGWVVTPINDLRTRPTSRVRQLPPPDRVSFAVVVGRHDRRVRLDEARLEGAAAFRVIDAGHSFIMLKPSVHRLVQGFLATGTLPEELPAEAANAPLDRRRP